MSGFLISFVTLEKMENNLFQKIQKPVLSLDIRSLCTEQKMLVEWYCLKKVPRRITV